ncbi:2891_t:CDS:2, partial [Cetraspora pellucida]
GNEDDKDEETLEKKRIMEEKTASRGRKNSPIRLGLKDENLSEGKDESDENLPEKTADDEESGDGNYEKKVIRRSKLKKVESCPNCNKCLCPIDKEECRSKISRHEFMNYCEFTDKALLEELIIRIKKGMKKNKKGEIVEDKNFAGNFSISLKELMDIQNSYRKMEDDVKKILKDAYDDISEKEFIKERKFVNQVAKKLLPKQKIKIRFVEELEDSRKLTHATDSVRFHPEYNPNATIFSRHCSRCGTPHPVIMTGLLTNLEIPKQSIQVRRLLTTIENSFCGICEKEFTEKDIRTSNFVLILASRNNKISDDNILLSISSFRHEKCPREYRN